MTDHCPTCGAAVRVEASGVTHYMVPVDAERVRELEERIRELEAHLDALRSAVKALPVEEWVETSGDGSPELIGYVMQTAGEWGAVIKAMEPPR